MAINDSAKQPDIFSDRPIRDLNRDLLWKNNDDVVVGAQIESIANRIAKAVDKGSDRASEPPYDGEDSQTISSLTFAVHGPWGSGKTSFIKMVLKRTREILGSDKQKRLLECEYQSSAFEGTTLGAKASLCRQILLTLADGDAKRAIRIFAKQFERSSDGSDPIDFYQAEDLYKDGRLNLSSLIALKSQYLEEIAKLNTLTDFCEIIETELSPQGLTRPGLQRTLVVILDDLDRCSHEFTASLLNAIQQWSGIDRLFFILAIDREILNRTISGKYKANGDSSAIEISPEVALEKYVQYSVDVPELNEAQVKAFVEKFLDVSEHPLSSLFRKNADLIARGIRVRTPRGIKKCLNTISPSLSKSLEDRAGEVRESKDFRSKLKERLLEYTWRIFYRNFYLRGKDRQNQFTMALVAIERAAFDYNRDEDSVQLEFSLNRIRNRLNVSSEAIPLDFELVGFLALRPWFSLTDEILKQSSLQLILSGIIPADQPEKEYISAQELLSQKSPIKQLEEYSRMAREANIRDDFQTIIDSAIGSLRLAESQFDAFTPDEVVDYSNLGLYVERVATVTGNPQIQELALSLFQTGYRLNPGRIQSILAFVSFILDAKHPRLERLYPFCVEILGDRSQYNNSEEFSEYLTYKARLEFVMYGSDSSWRTWIDWVVAEIEEGTAQDNDTAFRRLVAFYGETDNQLDNEPLKRAARIYIPRASGQVREVAMLRYADSLGKNTQDSEAPEVKEAFEVYRYIVRPIEEGGIQDTPRINFRGNAFHNFAVGLKRVGYLEAAGHYWYQAYSLLRGKDSGNLIPAYARYLEDDCNRPDLAELVKEQEVLPEEVVAQQDGRTLPEHFVDGGIRSIFDI